MIGEVRLVPAGVQRPVAAYPELAAVLAAAVQGRSFRSPLAWVSAHGGIGVLLAVLVFATALTIDPAALRRLPRNWRPLLAAVITGVTVLPALSWAASQLVPGGPLREGIMTAGLAPCEIASVATTAMAGGDAVLSAGILIGSTLATVATAGPVLTLAAGRAAVHPGRILASLALMVALPLAGGLLLRARVPVSDRAERAAATTATVAVAALVALVAAEVRPSAGYVPVILACGVFLGGSALAGRLLGTGSPRPAAAAMLLTTSMRDFAIAAGLATAAFGPAAAAPLGVYGVLVLVWGTAAAGRLRRHQHHGTRAAISG